MKARIISGGAVVLLLVGCVQIAVLGSSVESGEPDWWKAQNDVVAVLMEQRTDIAELVGKVTASKPKTGYEAMVKLSVLMRAGMNEAAAKAAEELSELCPDLGSSQISVIYYHACDDYEAWELARRLLEVFAERVTGVWLENRLLEHWLESGQSFDEIDGWLAEMSVGHKGYWVKERVRFNEAHGRGEKLVRELADGVKEHPEDIDGAIVFLEALIYSRDRRRQELDLSWFTATIKPKLATEAEGVAARLKTLEQWKAASAFFRRAIATPLTDEEVRDYGNRFQIGMPAQMLRARFAVNAREGLAQCLMEMGEKSEAQKWMVEAADIRKEHKLGMNALLAGEVQQRSGARVIEGRIKEQEKLSEDAPEYWRTRAEYYRGRREPENEEHALLKALSLTTPQLMPEQRSKGYTDLRSWVLSDYVRFLERMKRGSEAVTLLRKELAEAPAASESSKRAARFLAFDFVEHITVDDDLLWKWLAERPKWEHTEQRVLWRMLEKANPAETDKYFSRAESLAEGKHPSRASSLGWVMNRMGHAKRSIRLLEYAVERADDEGVKEEAGFTLFESYLDAGDWASAERIFPQARKRLTPTEATDWYARIAVAAAVAGRRADAMRIWRVAANANPARPTYLRRLAKRGLGEELAAFYSELAKKLPESDAPAKALKRLEEE